MKPSGALADAATRALLILSFLGSIAEPPSPSSNLFRMDNADGGGPAVCELSTTVACTGSLDSTVNANNDDWLRWRRIFVFASASTGFTDDSGCLYCQSEWSFSVSQFIEFDVTVK
jgi:hypothetical protein